MSPATSTDVELHRQFKAQKNSARSRIAATIQSFATKRGPKQKAKRYVI
jgi:hypothetical protein